MRFVALFIIFLLGLTSILHSQEAAPDDLVIVGEGMAVLHDDSSAAEEEAVWDAKRNAVEQAVGVFLKARAVGRDFKLESDQIENQTNGFVRRWEIVPGSRRTEIVGNGKILRLQVRAVVALIPVIRHLQDIHDVYDDLERPRIRIEVIGDSSGGATKHALLTALQAQEFETATGDTAEITLLVHIVSEPTIKLGDKEAVYGVGESVAACRAIVTVQVVSSASEQVLFTAKAEAKGNSFESDEDARTEAIAAAAQNLVTQEDSAFLRRLLVRWARERQEGHAVAIAVSGLDAKQRSLLSGKIHEMRGWVRSLGETETKDKTVFRFLTRLDTRAVRRRIADIRLDNVGLTLQTGHGPKIVCAASTRSRLSRK